MSTPSLEFFRRELAFRENARGFSLTLKRNCSISPAALACVFIALGALALAIAAGFALAGAWLILPFAGLEIVALAAAFLIQARHATDYERIDLEGGRLRLEVAQADALARYELDARRVRVDMSGHYVVLRGGPHEALELGRHLDARARAALASELKKRLRT